MMFSILGAAIFALTWGLTLFVVLPFGVKSQVEAEDVTPGTEEAAPVVPYIGRKLVATTALSLFLFGIMYLLVDILKIDIFRLLAGY